MRRTTVRLFGPAVVVLGALAIPAAARVPDASTPQLNPVSSGAGANRSNVGAGGTGDGKIVRLLTPPNPSYRSISVQTNERDGLRARNGALRSVVSPTPLTPAAERVETAIRVASLQATITASRAQVRPQFPGSPEVALDAEHDALERSSNETIINKNSFVIIDVPNDVDFDRFLLTLRSLDGVASAEPIPDPPPLPMSPDLQGYQGYRLPASLSGIGAGILANDVVGSTGANVKIVDVEYSWNQSHEDLDKAATALIPQGIPVDPFSDTNHGTAVLGILAGDADTQGVTGLVPDAAIGMVNAYGKADAAATSPTYNLPNAINIAAANLTPGDVILIEQQAAGLGPCDATQVGCVAVEWNLATYTAIRAAVLSGIIVVEAAGNGNQNLDAAGYGSPFPAGRADSGAIIVGAGSAPGCTAPVRSRLSFSTYGSRVNLQGWGQCVASTGYGGLYNGGGNALYTSSFGGTSSASPIVASAAAIVSSVAQQQGVSMSPTQVRQALIDTATAGAAGANIGGLPDVEAAVTNLFVPTATLRAPTYAAARSSIELDASGSTDPQNDPLSFVWDFNNDGLFDDAVGPKPSFNTGIAETTRTVRVRVTDAHGASKSASANIVIAYPPRAPAPQAPGASVGGQRDGAPSAPPGPGSSTPRGPAPQA